MQMNREQSPLELYQTAYNLHYRERKISSACLVYERIIRDFPQSDAAAYASVQLQKIQANETLRKLARGKAPVGPIILFSAINFILLVGALLFGFIQIRQIRTSVDNQKTMARAIGKMYANQDEQALEILNDLKIIAQGDITPYALSAEIHRKNKRFLKARKEFETFRRLYPRHQLPAAELALIDTEEEEYRKERAESKPADAVAEKTSPKPANRAKPRSRSAPKRKPRLLIDPDSLTFF